MVLKNLSSCFHNYFFVDGIVFVGDHVADVAGTFAVYLINNLYVIRGGGGETIEENFCSGKKL